MSEYCLYLPPEDKQDVMSERYKHMMKQINREHHGVRIYIKGLDFHDEKEKPLPFATIDGKAKSFNNFWEEVIGERKLDEDYDGD